MNVELIKSKIEAFFANTTPEYIVSEFKNAGYTFIDNDVEWNSIPTYITCYNNRFVHRETLLERLEKVVFRHQYQKKLNNLTSDYLGSFFFLKIAQ